MPHICTRCKNQIEAAPGQAPRCPVCGGRKFSFISPRKEEPGPEKRGTDSPDRQVIPEEPVSIQSPAGVRPELKETDTADINESIESIRIIEPGLYNLNLVRLAESDDRVIRVGADGRYRLDLHSMMRKKKK